MEDYGDSDSKMAFEIKFFQKSSVCSRCLGGAFVDTSFYQRDSEGDDFDPNALTLAP